MYILRVAFNNGEVKSFKSKVRYPERMTVAAFNWIALRRWSVQYPNTHERTRELLIDNNYIGAMKSENAFEYMNAKIVSKYEVDGRNKHMQAIPYFTLEHLFENF